MVNQQKVVQQETAYSAVVVNDHNNVSPSLPISFCHVFMTPFGTKKIYIGTGIHMIIHYNCTIGSFLLHSFLLISHPYPPSFHEMIFTLVPLIFLS